jgi:hypothetical protein
MNAKKAKALRKKLGLKPTEPRKYEGQTGVLSSIVNAAKAIGRPTLKPKPRVLAKDSLRARYQAAKRRNEDSDLRDLLEVLDEVQS